MVVDKRKSKVRRASKRDAEERQVADISPLIHTTQPIVFYDAGAISCESYILMALELVSHEGAPCIAQEIQSAVPLPVGGDGIVGDQLAGEEEQGADVGGLQTRCRMLEVRAKQ